MLNRLYVAGLMGGRTLEVKFNPDLNLLYGINGSGKTTVLNIIAAIATGSLDGLSRYELKEVVLDYSRKGESRSIKLVAENPQVYRIHWSGGTFTVNVQELVDRRREVRIGGLYPRKDAYPPKLQEMTKEIPLTYLPLSRDSRSFDNMYPRESPYMFELEAQYQRRYMEDPNVFRPSRTLDDSLEFVGVLVKESHRRMMLELNKFNEDLRQRMFESSMSASARRESVQAMKAKADRWSDKAIRELKGTLKELHLLTPDLSTMIDGVTGDFRAAWESVVNAANGDDTTRIHAVYDFVLASLRLDLLEKWRDLAEETNNKKALVLRPMTTFLDTINSFLTDSGKQISFDSGRGNLGFSSSLDNYTRQYGLEQLSSGEKQLTIFFAYLIFSYLYNTSQEDGVFLIDEPELSLHVGWQRRFTKAVTQAAPGLQLVFATHSPEIIGPYRKKSISISGGID